LNRSGASGVGGDARERERGGDIFEIAAASSFSQTVQFAFGEAGSA
jgi:hypothetical protein